MASKSDCLRGGGEFRARFHVLSLLHAFGAESSAWQQQRDSATSLGQCHADYVGEARNSIMDSSIQRLLSDKLYDRRKAGALESVFHVAVQGRLLTTINPRLESAIRNALNDNNHDRIAKIVHQLCHDFAYAVHQPHARNGGLIGLAAAAIALGPVGVSVRAQIRVALADRFRK